MTIAGNVMIIDDEIVMRKAISGALASANFTSIEHTDGLAALEYFKKSFSEIDLVLLDLNMPEISGLEVLEKLKEIKPDVKVLIVTGDYPDEKKRQTFVSEYVQCISKPFNIPKLVNRVTELLSK
jgi:DNA-binding response OmpR family regulator